MATLLVGSLLTLASPVMCYRRNDAAVLSPGFAGVEQFLAWASKSCGDCGETIGGLLQGVQDAGYLEGSAWQGDTLTVELSESRLYGEIAATSRIPISWTLDGKATFAFSARDDGATVVRVDGFGVQPAPQGLELYEAAMKYSKVDATKCVDDKACIDLEVKAAGKYLYSNWKQIKKSDDKVARIMKTLYSRYAIYLAVESLGKWGEVFYALLMPKPAAITSFVFSKGTVYTTFDILADPKYDKYHLGPKVDLGPPVFGAYARGTCSLSVKLNQTDFDNAEWSDSPRELVEYVRVRGGQDLATDVNPGQNPCKARLSGVALTAEEARYETASHDVTADIEENAVLVDAKISPLVDECASDGFLLDAVAEVTCTVTRLNSTAA